MSIRRRSLPRAALSALLALLAVAVGAAGCGSGGPADNRSSAAKDRRALAGSPPPLAGLHRQANRLLGGGPKAFKARLRKLRGYPVVINKWASWCGPCRREFPFFQRQARKRGKRIAFIGINSKDSRGSARAFLRRFPVSFPSYRDPDLEVAALVEASFAFPTTVFLDRRGRQIAAHPGGYNSEAALEEDIERYG